MKEALYEIDRQTCLGIGYFEITKSDEFRGSDVQRLALIVLEGMRGRSTSDPRGGKGSASDLHSSSS